MTVSTAQQLQQLFGQAAALPFNAVSKGVFTALHTCITSIIVAVTGIALTAAD